MAHHEQFDFFWRLKLAFGDKFSRALKVLEVGSQDINGSIRQFFDESIEYIGIDLGAAPGVDFVMPGELIELPSHWADITVSTECFEHCESWAEVLINMHRITKPGGMVIVTCAYTGRAAHGTIDSEIGSSPFTGNYYKNLEPKDFESAIDLSKAFGRYSFEIEQKANDLHFWGERSCEEIASEENRNSMPPIERLARAQGQLAQAVTIYSKVQLENNFLCKESELAKQEAEVAKQEAEVTRQQLNKVNRENQIMSSEVEEVMEALEKFFLKSQQDESQINQMSEKIKWLRWQREAAVRALSSYSRLKEAMTILPARIAVIGDAGAKD